MPDEQIIYLDPNDELTRVREKIEEVRARRITMVVPQQTQLRSNVGWRLLHARARELGKEVQVISPDRQVRAVAKAAGFRVGQPADGSLGGRTRIPASQNPRNVAERKGMQRQRQPFNRGPAESQAPRRRQPTVPPPSPAPEDLPTEILPPRNTWVQQENQPAPPQEPGEPGEHASKQGQEDAYPPIEIIEDDAFDRPYEFRIDEAPGAGGQPGSSRPLAAHPEEEYEDPYMQDYHTARQIRAAHEEGKASRASNPSAINEEPTSTFPSSRFSTPPEPGPVNPFEEEIEEMSPSGLPEQSGGATFPLDVDNIAPDVADIPTQEHVIEDVEEPFDSQDFPVAQWDNAPLNLQDDRFSAPAADTGMRGGRRSGKLPRTYEEEDADFLPPVDQSTLMRPKRPAPSGPIGPRRGGNRGAQVPPPQAAARSVTTRPVSQTPRSGQPPAPSQPVTRSRVPAAPPPPRRTRQASRRRGRLVTIAVVAVLVLLLLIGVGLFYFGTTATVTITVPSKNLNQNSFKLVASTNTKSKFPNSVASQVLTYNASVPGTGTATGHTSQGNAVASGLVNFTNNGQQLVTVPSGIQLTTTAGNGSISFVTAATAVIAPASSGIPFVPVPVKAQSPGRSGNVAANTITVVPSTSITTIAQASTLSPSQINLSVTNPSALTGGGATQVPAVTQNDLQALRNSLHRQLQDQIKTWLHKQLHQGDIAGKFFPDVVDSAQPLPQEQLIQAPAAGNALSSKTFTGTLRVTVKVLVVRSTSLVAAARSRLNGVARPYVLPTQALIQTTIVSSSASSDGQTITITMSASGQAILPVDKQAVGMYIAGKTKDQASNAIINGDAGPRGVQKVEITISPSFLGIMPFRSDNIHIDVKPGIPVKG